MLFANKIRQLREERKLLQRHLAAALDMDTPMFSKIERGERPAKRVQVISIAKPFFTHGSELLTLGLANKVVEVLKNEKELAVDALKIVKSRLVFKNNE